MNEKVVLAKIRGVIYGCEKVQEKEENKIKKMVAVGIAYDRIKEIIKEEEKNND